MLFEVGVAVLLGFCAGTITGLVPGIHINLVAAFVLAQSATLNKFSPISIGVFIVSMSITHTFFDFIPSVFLGVPEEDTAVSIFPAHKMLLEGRGYEAVVLSVIGSMVGLIAIIGIVPLLVISVPKVYSIIEESIALILIGCLCWLIFSEKQKIWAIIVVVLAGSLGLICFELQVRDVLFPLFSGLFGISMLLMSIKQKVKIPSQKKSFPLLNTSDGLVFGRAGVASLLTGLLPGLGAAQAAMLALGKNADGKQYILVTGAINTMIMIVGLVAWMSLGKARNGSVVALMRLLPELSWELLGLLLCVALLVGGLCTLVVPLYISGFSWLVQRVKYSLLCWIVISLVVVLVGALSGWIGLVITIVAACVGITCALVGVKKSLMMTCLMVPIILFFLGF